jgi:hypothetical protein
MGVGDKKSFLIASKTVISKTEKIPKRREENTKDYPRAYSIMKTVLLG